MNSPHHERIRFLAQKIREARLRGNHTEEEEYVKEFNDLLVAATIPETTTIPENASVAVDQNPISPQEEHVELKREEETLESEIIAVRENAREALVEDLRTTSPVFDAYPEEIKPLLTSLLEEVSTILQMPRVVLQPQFIEELDRLVEEKMNEEPLLQKLAEEARLRSILNRYRGELINILQDRNK